MECVSGSNTQFVIADQQLEDSWMISNREVSGRDELASLLRGGSVPAGLDLMKLYYLCITAGDTVAASLPHPTRIYTVCAADLQAPLCARSRIRSYGIATSHQKNSYYLVSERFGATQGVTGSHLLLVYYPEVAEPIVYILEPSEAAMSFVAAFVGHKSELLCPGVMIPVPGVAPLLPTHVFVPSLFDRSSYAHARCNYHIGDQVIVTYPESFFLDRHAKKFLNQYHKTDIESMQQTWLDVEATILGFVVVLQPANILSYKSDPNTILVPSIKALVSNNETHPCYGFYQINLEMISSLPLHRFHPPDRINLRNWVLFNLREYFLGLYKTAGYALADGKMPSQPHSAGVVHARAYMTESESTWAATQQQIHDCQLKLGFTPYEQRSGTFTSDILAYMLWIDREPAHAKKVEQLWSDYENQLPDRITETPTATKADEDLLDITDEKQAQKKAEIEKGEKESSQAAEDRELAASRAQASASKSKPTKAKGRKVAAEAKRAKQQQDGANETAPSAGEEEEAASVRRGRRQRQQTQQYAPSAGASSSAVRGRQRPTVDEKEREEKWYDSESDPTAGTDEETEDQADDSEYSSASSSTAISSTKRKRSHTGTKVRQSVNVKQPACATNFESSPTNQDALCLNTLAHDRCSCFARFVCCGVVSMKSGWTWFCSLPETQAMAKKEYAKRNSIIYRADLKVPATERSKIIADIWKRRISSEEKKDLSRFIKAQNEIFLDAVRKGLVKSEVGYHLPGPWKWRGPGKYTTPGYHPPAPYSTLHAQPHSVTVEPAPTTMATASGLNICIPSAAGVNIVVPAAAETLAQKNKKIQELKAQIMKDRLDEEQRELEEQIERETAMREAKRDKRQKEFQAALTATVAPAADTDRRHPASQPATTAAPAPAAATAANAAANAAAATAATAAATAAANASAMHRDGARRLQSQHQQQLGRRSSFASTTLQQVDNSSSSASDISFPDNDSQLSASSSPRGGDLGSSRDAENDERDHGSARDDRRRSYESYDDRRSTLAPHARDRIRAGGYLNEHEQRVEDRVHDMYGRAHANTLQDATEVEMETMKESYERQLRSMELCHQNKLAWAESRQRLGFMKKSSDIAVALRAREIRSYHPPR